MSHSMMPQQSQFTLESLVALGQWSALQTNTKKKVLLKASTGTKQRELMRIPGKPEKTEL